MMQGAVPEIRIALVLYGGVSLAVYENGVTRCFHHLVRASGADQDLSPAERGRRHGVLGLLADLAGGRVVVDVIAGTSAGGINGIMLAAAMENGSDFPAAEALWRRDADFGRLLRRPGPGAPASLLDGERYYHGRLIEGLSRLCTPRPGYQSPGEIDLFVTATDLHGQESQWIDDQGHAIRDRCHRVVFHFKHRPGRKRLGLAAGQLHAPDANGLQARILAAAACMTSTFPVAFPPFRLDQSPLLDESERQEVGRALELCSASGTGGGAAFSRERLYIDGGVLDNKPFGPALRAIFYRMPTGPVKRRLFYVEPDPRIRTANSQTAGDPLSTAAAALVGIPAHESILADLEALDRHNAQVAWLQAARDQVEGGGEGEDMALYLATRLESLGRALLVSSDGVPSAHDLVPRGPRQALLEAIRQPRQAGGKDDKAGVTDRALMDSLDVDYHLRLAFTLLYQCHERLAKNPGRGKEQDQDRDFRAMLLIGRLIIALKVMRALLVELRGPVLAACGEVNADNAQKRIWDTLLPAFGSFLSREAPWWQGLVHDMEQPVEDLFTAPLPPEGAAGLLFSSATLSRVLAEGRRAVAAWTPPEPAGGSGCSTILDMLCAFCRAVMTACHGTDHSYMTAVLQDERLYPLRFTSGIHELDRIRCVRISPRDAQRGLSGGRLEDKLTGEDLAHFSAFLRRDWRSNDILRGRLDGVCQLVETLLDDERLEELAAGAEEFSPLLAPEALALSLPRCPEDLRRSLARSWTAFVRAAREEARAGTAAGRDGGKTAKTREAREALAARRRQAGEEFKEALVLAGQYDVFLDGVEQVAEDYFYQDMEWGRLGPGQGAPTHAGGPGKEARAQALARELMAANQDRPDHLLEWFTRIARQKAVGPDGAVPGNVLGGYAARTYMLGWKMIEGALGRPGERAMARLRPYLYAPVRFLGLVHDLVRHEGRAATVVVGAIAAALLGFAAASLLLGRTAWGLAALAVLGAYGWLLPRMAPENRGREIRLALAAAVGLAAVLLAAAAVAWLSVNRFLG